MTAVLERLRAASAVYLTYVVGRMDAARALRAAPLMPEPAEKSCPAEGDLERLSEMAKGAESEIVEALMDANRVRAVRWQQCRSSAATDAGVMPHSAWCNLASPEGPFRTKGLRLAFKCWGAGLSYDWHSRAAAESYHVLAGDAMFSALNREDRWSHAGARVDHESWLPHALQMGAQGLLALVLWEGADVMHPAVLEAQV